MTPVRALSIAALCFAVLAPPAFAEGGRFYGMLRERDLTPFGFLRLDMRPAHAVSIEPHTFAFETSLGYQNTWALSPNVEKYLTSIESEGRHEIGPAEVQAIRDLPGENYLLDVETATLDLAVHYKISSQWTAYAIATAVSYHGGFLDSGIEQFHDFLGFSTFGRPAVTRNDTNLILDLKGGAGGAARRAAHRRASWIRCSACATRASTCRSTGRCRSKPRSRCRSKGERLLLSTGRTDYGMQASLRHLGGHNAFHMDFAAVYYAGERVPAPHEAQIVPTIVLGWERQLTDRTNSTCRVMRAAASIANEQTDLDELLNDKFQLSLGVRHRFDCCLMSFAITENLQNLNNTPDIGFQIGIRLGAAASRPRCASGSAGGATRTQATHPRTLAPGAQRGDDGGVAGRKHGGGIELGDPGQALVRRQRAGIAISLRVVEAGRGEELRIPLGFHAFGHQLEAQRMRHLRGGLDDDAVVGVVAHAQDEGPVELERMHRQVAQVSQRGIPGAEIVDGNQHAQLVNFLDHAQRARRVEHHRALGDLQLQ